MQRPDPAPRTAWLRAPAIASVVLFPWAWPADLSADSQPLGQAMLLSVDATDAPRRALRARLVIPAKPGPLTLVYPKWIPGEHGPTGPISDLAGLQFKAGDQPLRWRRDDVDMYAYSCVVPAETEAVTVNLDFLSPPASAGRFSAGASCSAKLAVISWNHFVLYPKGSSPSEIECRAEIAVPQGWQFASALPVENRSGAKAAFAPVSLETLIDSPVLCGQYMKELTIGPSQRPAHYLHLAADSPEALRLDSSLAGRLDTMVAEAGAMFGSRPYTSYHFLVALSDHLAHFGLEHRHCSDNRVPERLFLDDALMTAYADLLPHEYIHSWNGKFRRPRDMVTPDYQAPLRTRLLWIYEGLTDYLDTVLSTRCGLSSPAEFRDSLALYAQYMKNNRGRRWRPLDDAAAAFHVFDGNRSDGAAWRRSQWDVYAEGAMIWLEADCIIRTESRGQRSLDDFCRQFFGKADGPSTIKPYTLEEVIGELKTVAPYDWAEFFEKRAAGVSEEAPLRGIELSGWQLVYADTPSYVQQAWDQHWAQATDLSASIGLWVNDNGTVVDVVPGEAADRAGVAPGMKIAGVNMRRFTLDELFSAIASTKELQTPLELLIENADYFSIRTLDYHEGQKYARLRRDGSKPDLLREIIKPLSGQRRTDTKNDE